LLRAADVALYRAKAVGKGAVAVFDPALDEPALGRLEREIALRRALDRRELWVSYQPIVHLASRTIAGVEALVRWAHPERGLVGPDEFVPVAEETGLILPLGRWLREEACGQVRRWQECHPSDPPLRLSTNLSPREFRQPSLVADLTRLLAATGLLAGSLTLEITESVAVTDPDVTAAMLRTLAEIGVRLAVDDFGTGYASLSSLKHVRVDELKIDRSFVAGLGRNHEDTAIVRATIGVAKALGLRTTAEGVETAEQATALLELGCDLGQGFFFAPPLTAGEMGALLRKRTTPAIHAA
jgi:EAL domain-containing protein (putative c-di-GMP-specific phosphodiesterase class I)